MRVRGLFLATFIALSAAAPASAQDGVIGGPDLCQDSACGGWLFFGAIAGTAALTVDSILIGEAIDKATHGHGLYAGGASFEIFWGISHIATGAAVAAHVAPNENWGLLGIGVPLALVGGYFVIHGAFSLGSARPPPPPEPDDEAAQEEPADEPADEESAPPSEEQPDEEEPAAEPVEPAAAVSLAPTLGGVMVQVFGTF